MGSDAARKRPSIPSKFLNSSTTVLKGQPLPESRLTLCNKDKAAIKLTTMNHPPPTHHHDHNCRRRRRHNNNNNNNNNNQQQQQQQQQQQDIKKFQISIASQSCGCHFSLFHFSIFATLNNHQQQLAFQQQTGKAVSFGAHIVIFFFPNEHILLGPLATQSTSPMHVVYLSGQQLS
ncbi:hypothetical protein T4B_3564 [Trichinella pseudospiralis]|uniref:Uncharacterized protein n=1 Tax=Trichinella pseudospiralis TaxID=6337 RepID=A0A0V1IX18_TRIPS|nr:hypothetical protein T4B_3564 [Trichinella pseudospiralis]